ncbi:MAG: hypothetical protein U0871_05725 [Gemmataceae bacterium]
MRWAARVARVLVGLPFVVVGLNYWLLFLPVNEEEMAKALPEVAKGFAAALVTTHYMDVVKALEVVGGLLVLSGRMTPLGLALVTPVAVNILLWDLLLAGKPGLGVVLTALCVFLMYAYRSYFAGLLATHAHVG